MMKSNLTWQQNAPVQHHPRSRHLGYITINIFVDIVIIVVGVVGYEGGVVVLDEVLGRGEQLLHIAATYNTIYYNITYS
jgi:hypothetical protein